MDPDILEKKQLWLIGNDAKCTGFIVRTLGDRGRLSGLEVSSDCQNALRQLRQSHPHCPRLILLDLEMPDRAAFRFLETLKADRLLRMIPVIVLAADDDPGTVAASYGLGAVGYLVRRELGPEFAKKIQSACGYWTLSRVPAL